MRKNVFLALLLSFLVLYIALMIVFTFFDYQITSALYNPKTGFGIFLEATGPMFMPFFIIYSTIGLALNLKFSTKSKTIFSYIGLGFLFIYGTFMGVMTHLHSYAPWMFVPSIVIYLLFTVLCVYLNKLVKQKYQKLLPKHVKILFIMLITSSVSLLGVDIIKCLFGRIRYIDLVNANQFKPWFYINNFLFNSSFPSGHTARATTAICFSLIPLYFSKTKLSCIVLLITILFGIATGISRLFEGMHYPTDIITGFAFVFLSFYISKYYLLDKSDTIAS